MGRSSFALMATVILVQAGVGVSIATAQSTVVQVPGHSAALTPGDWQSGQSLPGFAPYSRNVPTNLPMKVRAMAESMARTAPAAVLRARSLEEVADAMNASGIPTIVHSSVDASDRRARLALLPNLPLSSALTVVLDEWDMGWTFIDDYLLIAQVDYLEEYPMIVVYDITALAPTVEAADDLHWSMTDTIYPDTWEHNGGVSRIQILPIRERSLMTIAAPWPVHRRVMQWLDSADHLGGPAIQGGHTPGRHAISSSPVAPSASVQVPQPPIRRGLALPGSGTSGGMGGGGGGQPF